MLKTFSITDIGRKRRLNQDVVYASAEPVGNLPNLFIVADGMGGHNAGDYASRVTVETLIKEIASSREKKPKEIISWAMDQANECIRRTASENADMEGMGTTVVLATCADNQLLVANVGDSRLYVAHQDKLVQITKDHSLVEEMVRMGGLAKEAARNHPDKNIITRAVGASDTVETDFFEVELKKGDLFLLCSDGLTNMLEDGEIFDILQKASREKITGLEEKARKLVDSANENGGRDNISVVLVDPFCA